RRADPRRHTRLAHPPLAQPDPARPRHRRHLTPAPAGATPSPAGADAKFPAVPASRSVTMQADGNSNGPGPASSRSGPDRGPHLAGVWRTANAAVRAGRNRLEPTVAGRVWIQLRELGFMNSSLQFAALFTLGFIPFLIVLSVALGPGLSRAMVMGSGFNARAGHDVTMLFSHSRTAPTSLSVLAVLLAVLGGSATSHMIQAWYGKIFR